MSTAYTIVVFESNYGVQRNCNSSGSHALIFELALGSTHESAKFSDEECMDDGDDFTYKSVRGYKHEPWLRRT